MRRNEEHEESSGGGHLAAREQRHHVNVFWHIARHRQSSQTSHEKNVILLRAAIDDAGQYDTSKTEQYS